MSRTLWMMKPASAFTASSVQPEPVWSADSDLPRQQTVEREQALCAGQCSDLRPLTHRPQGGTSHGQGTRFRVYLEKSAESLMEVPLYGIYHFHLLLLIVGLYL